MQQKAHKVSVLAGLWLAFGVVSAACSEPSGDPITPLDGSAMGACEGEAPACLVSCSLQTPIAQAACRGSRWSCDQGVSAALCCDAANAPDNCATWEDACDIGWGCPPGYTCVKSRAYQAPAEAGVCRLGELDVPPEVAGCSDHGLTAPELLPLMGPGVAKIDGLVVIEYKCEDKTCPEQDPCCQECGGSYRLSLGIDNEFGKPLVLPIRTESLSCFGTNCSFTCAPMQPGRAYRLWGSYVPSTVAGQPGTLYHVGHCAL